MTGLRFLIIAILVVGLLGACAGMTSQQQRVLSGGAIGAGAGAAVSGLSGGSVVTGTAIGAGAGAVGGYLYDRSKRR